MEFQYIHHIKVCVLETSIKNLKTPVLETKPHHIKVGVLEAIFPKP